MAFYPPSGTGSGTGSGDVIGPGSTTDNAVIRANGTSGTSIQNSPVLISDAGDITGALSITLPHAGLHILDTDASHDMIIVPGANLTSDREFTITTDDAARTLTMLGDINVDSSFTVSGGSSLTLNVTGTTSITLPTSGTVATSATRLSEFAAPNASLNLGSQKITNLAEPSASTDGCTKAYADAIAAGLDLHSSSRVATTADLNATYNAGGKTLTCNVNGAISVDGVSLSLNDRLLVKNQTTGQENGIYYVTTVGTAGTPFVITRATDFDTSGEIITGAFTFVTAGTTNAATGWVLTTPATITMDTTALSFTTFSAATNYVAGGGMTLTGLTFAVPVGTGLTQNADSLEVDFTAVQAIDTDLTAISALATTGLLARTGAGTYSTRTITGSQGVAVTNGDGVSGAPALATDINSLTTDSSPDGSSDYVMTYDVSAASNKKVLIRNIPGQGADISSFRQAGTGTFESWYNSQSTSGSSTTTSLSVNFLRAVPLVNGRSGTIDGLGINVTTGIAGGVCRIGIYQATSSTDLYPSALVYASDEISTATSGVKLATGVSITLDPSTLYYIAIITGVGAATYRTQNSAYLSPVLGNSSLLSGVPYTGFYYSLAYTSLPATFPAGATLGTGNQLAGYIHYAT